MDMYSMVLIFKTGRKELPLIVKGKMRKEQVLGKDQYISILRYLFEMQMKMS